MGKLNAALLRYLSKDDFRVLTGVRSCPARRGSLGYVINAT